MLQRTAGPQVGPERGIDKLRYSEPVQAAFQNHNAVEKALKRGKISSQESGKCIQLCFFNIPNYIFYSMPTEKGARLLWDLCCSSRKS